MHIASEIFPESDKAVTDAARFIFGSPDNMKVISNFGDKNFEVDSIGDLWDNSLDINTGQDLIRASEITEKTTILCPFHDDNSSSAFIAYSKKNENWFIRCSACGKSLDPEKSGKTFWMEKDAIEHTPTSKYWSHGTDIWEFGFAGEEFYQEKIGRHKYHIFTQTLGKEDRDPAYSTLVEQNHISHLSRIDHIADPAIDNSTFRVMKNDGIIEVRYSAIANNLDDNALVEAYLNDRFGDHIIFIKQWLAVYAYTNYQKLPTLILKGGRGTGKSTFAEIVGEIYPQLTAEWHGHESDFTYEVEKKLLIVEENETSAMNQYKTLKKYAGQKYATVNKKFKDPYRVRNNMSMIMLTNEAIPMYAAREEAPTNDANNQFFVYEFPDLSATIDPQLSDKILDRLGHYIRTELKTVYDRLDTAGYRYSISVPITQEEEAMFKSNVTDIEHTADRFIEKLVLGYSSDIGSAYHSFIADGYVPVQFFSDYTLSSAPTNRIVKQLQRTGYLTTDRERIQKGKERHYCYVMTQKLKDEILAAADPKKVT